MGLRVQSWTVGPFQTNCYLVIDEDSQQAILFDAGMEPEVLAAGVEQSGATLVALVNTHGHIDHVAGNALIKKRFDVPILIHAADEPMLQGVAMQARMFGVDAVNSPPPDRYLDEGDTLELGDWSFELRHVPGHSPGSLVFYQPEHQFCVVGDTLFQGSIGRTDLPGGDFDTLAQAIRSKLYTLPDETVILPGHMGLSKIGVEKATNPFVRA